MTTAEIAEIWLPITDFAGLYEVSNLGRVRSLDARVRTYQGIGTRVRKGRVLKLKLQNGGYQIVLLSKSSVVRTFTVHRLVASAFLAKPNGVSDLTVNHRDFDKTNNRVENLEWVSQSENLGHSGRAGRMIRANVTKLTEDDVRDIRRRLAAGETLVSIGQAYGVAHTAIYKIKAGLRWKHIT